MRRKAPGHVRLEHVVLEDEVAGVVPVVRDLVPVVVAHDVGRSRSARAARIPFGSPGPGDVLLASADPVARSGDCLVVPPESAAVLDQSI